MLIGICGTICAGKHSVQDYLIQQHDFIALELVHNISGVETSASQDAVPRVQRAHTSRVSFATVNDLLDFATEHWQQRFCTTSIHDEATVEALCHRPFFLLLHIDAPLFTRWQRFKTQWASTSRPPPTLEQFVQSNDTQLYNSTTGGLAALASRAQIQLLNSTSSLPSLHSALDALNLTDETRLRPTWDHYFMTLASLAARRSNCMRRQVGCVLVRENRVIATGYNGTPRHITNCNAGGCSRCNDGGGRSGVGLSTCLCLHAEENALLEAGRERVGGGAVLYCNTCPCLTCSIKIVQVGITEVVFNSELLDGCRDGQDLPGGGSAVEAILAAEGGAGNSGRRAGGSSAGQHSNGPAFSAKQRCCTRREFQRNKLGFERWQPVTEERAHKQHRSGVGDRRRSGWSPKGSASMSLAQAYK
ncbi:Deoxycytidine monophosphate (dCMP) deaminase [Friedmanniomyces endolithicus]|nr:Deoxycytidine monophosphate (dCMP) deaminase [Friedmanniomyces endolithicus]